jgi:hypothetical protein
MSAQGRYKALTPERQREGSSGELARRRAPLARATLPVP